jgi:hypothetical protein
MTSRDSRKGNIQLGDLIRALSNLDWQDGHAADIAASLGFNVSQLPDIKPSDEISNPRLDEGAQKIQPAKQPTRKPVTPPRPKLPPALPTIKSSNQRLHERSERAQEASLDIKWTQASKDLLADSTLPKLTRSNLFPDRVSRHIFTATLNTQRTGRKIDLPCLIERICHQPLIFDLPYKAEFTLDAGCHLLRDFSHSMMPFREDLFALESQVMNVVGPGRVHTYNFDSVPETAMRWTLKGERDQWRADGRPVLVATDFAVRGMTRNPRLDQQWQGIIAQCQRASSPLTFLTPWPRDFSPRDPSGYARVLHWSPRTTVAMIKRHLAGNTR